MSFLWIHNLKIQVLYYFWYGKNDICAVIIMFKYLLEDDEFRLMLKEFEYEFEKLDGRVDSIPVEKILDTMGIPKNYIDIIDM